MNCGPGNRNTDRLWNITSTLYLYSTDVPGRCPPVSDDTFGRGRKFPHCARPWALAGNFMGTDLYQIGNHKLRLREMSFKELISELKVKLDNTKLVNESFLHQFALDWNSDRLATIELIKARKDWRFLQEDEYYSFANEMYLEIDGPHDLRISIDEFKLTFWNPPYRYRQWIELKNQDGTDAVSHRDYWRQYMFQIISLFGGDRVIYLADNGHPLDKYIHCDCPFSEIEAKLLNEFGKPADSFEAVAEDYQRRYFIDRFQDFHE